MQTPNTIAGVAEAQTKESNSAFSPITIHPLVGVAGVLIGAMSYLFTSRLLSVGLADVQGAIGATSDAMSWVSTSFNAACMFIGPLTVFLGALYGPRRVLLWASVAFMLSELLSPLVAHNIGALIAMQIVAGLACGTYYPLTMTLMVRNLPLKYLHLGIAAYALDILGDTHIATALEAWYMNHLSWHWIFWNALWVTPLLMVCIYFGVPRQPLPQKGPHTNLWGFLYLSCALTLIFCGLDQGERLDWFNSGVINGFFVSGLFMLAVTIIKHMRQPSPLLNLRFLTARNFLLLGVVLTSFRFLLLAPVMLLPQYLEVLHGYRSDQTGQVLAWIAIPELIAAPIAGYLLYKMDSRLICAIGFALVGFTCFADSRIDPGWTGETFVVTQVLNAIGLAFALTGLIASILRNALALGALKNPNNILTISCWFHICRLFGAEIGKAIMVRFLKVQSTLHYTILAQHVDGGFLTEERLKLLVGHLFAAGAGYDDARVRALTELGTAMKQQIALLTISDGFLLVALCAACCLLVLGLMVYAPPIMPPQRESASG
jgi:DHA2 family multidrug resistance protein